MSPALAGARAVSLVVSKWKGGSADGYNFAGPAYTNVTVLLIAA
ncbi:hypothetical protein [Amycolatopsis anabasis]|nr:hypothetical protein [Amycolatopsis anabasis]